MAVDRAELALLRRARDIIDHDYAEALDVPSVAARVHLSAAHFARRFKAVYGETPYNYLMTRRIERACSYLRAGATVTETCMAVGATSLGSFSTRFLSIMGETPSAYRARLHPPVESMPYCVAGRHLRVRIEQNRRSRAVDSASTLDA